MNSASVKNASRDVFAISANRFIGIYNRTIRTVARNVAATYLELSVASANAILRADIVFVNLELPAELATSASMELTIYKKLIFLDATIAVATLADRSVTFVIKKLDSVLVNRESMDLRVKNR